MKSISFLFSLILLFSACDIVVDLDIPEHEPVLVVNSVLSIDSIMTAHVSHSKGAFDSNSISFVHNASVEVYEDGGLLGLMDEIAYYTNTANIDSSYVYHLNHKPTASKTYSYEIVHEDYEAVRAETHMPNAVDLIVEDVTLIEVDEYQSQYRTRFYFNDELNENYYRLRLISKSNDYPDYPIDFESSDASIISSVGVESDGAAYWGSEALFDDELFNGSKKEIILEFWWKSFYEAEYVLELTSVSKSYYTYIKSLTAHYNNQDQFLFAGEPVQVYTNIENGLGILGASNTKSVEFILPE
jgi:hypothetical protein